MGQDIGDLQGMETSEIFISNENRWILGPDVTVPGGRMGFYSGSTRRKKTLEILVKMYRNAFI